jgi:dCMP deaminase
MSSNRPTWNEYFMQMAELAKTRSTCLSRQVGAVIVKDKRVITTGYNGAPQWCRNCLELGCLRREAVSGTELANCRAAHAEQNAIDQAAKLGTSVDGATIYTTLQPCTSCAKSIINSGIRIVFYNGEYADGLGMTLMKEAGITLLRYDKGDDSIDGEIRS